MSNLLLFINTIIALKFPNTQSKKIHVCICCICILYMYIFCLCAHKFWNVINKISSWISKIIPIRKAEKRKYNSSVKQYKQTHFNVGKFTLFAVFQSFCYANAAKCQKHKISTGTTTCLSLHVVVVSCNNLLLLFGCCCYVKGHFWIGT